MCTSHRLAHNLMHVFSVPVVPKCSCFHMTRLVELDKLKQLSRKQERKETVSRILMKIVQKIHNSMIFFS